MAGGRPPLVWSDAVLPVVLLVVGLPVLLANLGPAPWIIAVHTLLCALLVPARVYPVVVFTAALAVVLALWSAGVHLVSEMGLLAAYYHVLVRRPLRWGILASSMLAAGSVFAVFTPPVTLPGAVTEELPPDVVELIGPLMSVLSALVIVFLSLVTGVVALVVRNNRTAVAALESEAVRLRQERDQRALLAAEAERARIAREMHDVVGHSLGVMVSLSDGAALMARAQPERAVESMRTVADTGRSALSEVRGVLGVLREGYERPPPNVDVAELVARVRKTGLAVEFDGGDLSSLPDHLRLCVYRIVQETLTNTVKYAGRGAAASASVDVGDDEVRVEVVDDGFGRGPATGGSEDTGMGLMGLRERVGMYGGTIETGPTASGGWRVRASIPLDSVGGAL